MKVKSTVCVFAPWYCEAAALTAVTEQVVATALEIVAVPLLVFTMLQLPEISLGSTPLDETEVKEIAPAPEPPRVVTVIGVFTLAVVTAFDIVKSVVCLISSKLNVTGLYVA